MIAMINLEIVTKIINSNMKKITLILILLLICSCGKSKKDEKTSEEMKLQRFNESKEYVEYYEERVSLLAIAKGIPGETLKSILIDYYAATTALENVRIKDNENIITTISNKVNLPKSKVASLIYNFEYEMLTRDEIFDSETEKHEQEAAAEHEEEGPY